MSGCGGGQQFLNMYFCGGSGCDDLLAIDRENTIIIKVLTFLHSGIRLFTKRIY